MGVVQLPCKEDYFVDKDDPDSDFFEHYRRIKLSYSMFRYLWRNFHTSFQPTDLDDIVNDGADEADDSFFDDETVDEQEEHLEDVEQEDEVEMPHWYHKIQGFVDHINAVSKRLCKNPGSYIFDFFPDGRLATTTIAGSVARLIDCLPRKDELQYVVAMDNYFTTPRVITETRQKNVGIVGTARNRRGWWAQEYKDIEDQRFNTLYCWHHQDNYLVCRWIDNNVVNMVTTIHTGDETIPRARRKPRQTSTNRNHVRLVWGNDPKVTVDIPGMIDDYNHWMGGVDKADQYISYYRPNLRCRRSWMPIFLHCLDIMRVNGFLVVKSSDKRLDHKSFIISSTKILNDRAVAYESGVTRSKTAVPDPPGSGQKKKRRRMSHTDPQLPLCRFEGNPSDHRHEISSTQKRCIYCSFLLAKAKKEGREDLPKVREPSRCCSYCRVNLCHEHFDVFHSTT
ncbi:transposase IS4 [Nitzschia inconspicua]|uniref:Transposase IS4 n=1 Tax=Nitzschia inconspicua TaxID=303405 RepID=A0A9K3PRT6_9STRA|nr:transposase IS4 [Nitzschia inconspicua]